MIYINLYNIRQLYLLTFQNRMRLVRKCTASIYDMAGESLTPAKQKLTGEWNDQPSFCPKGTQEAGTAVSEESGSSILKGWLLDNESEKTPCNVNCVGHAGSNLCYSCGCCNRKNLSKLRCIRLVEQCTIIINDVHGRKMRPCYFLPPA